MKLITFQMSIVILCLLFSLTSGRRRNKRQIQKYYEFNLSKRYLKNIIRQYGKREEDEDSDLKKLSVNEDLAFQSSTSGGRDAAKAISGDCSLNGYSETLWSSLPMWYLDMENSYLIAKVIVNLQSTIGAQNFREAYLRATDLEPSLQHREFGNDFCGYFKGPGSPLQKINMYCGKKGTYLSIILNGNHMILEMCLIAVFSEPRDSDEKRLDVAPKFAKQISTDHGRKASRAITGDCGTGHHSETLWAKWPMWYVDLRKEYRVTKVIVGTRRHSKARRFHNIHIIMLNDKPRFIEEARSIYHDGCAFYKGPAVAGEEVTFHCGQKGRYLVVKVDSGSFHSSLEMCRVKIYGIDKTAAPVPSQTPAAGSEAAAEQAATEEESGADNASAPEETAGSASEPVAEEQAGEAEAMSQGNILVKTLWTILPNVVSVLIILLSK